MNPRPVSFGCPTVVSWRRPVTVVSRLHLGWEVRRGGGGGRNAGGGRDAMQCTVMHVRACVNPPRRTTPPPSLEERTVAAWFLEVRVDLRLQGARLSAVPRGAGGKGTAPRWKWRFVSRCCCVNLERATGGGATPTGGDGGATVADVRRRTGATGRRSTGEEGGLGEGGRGGGGPSPACPREGVLAWRARTNNHDRHPGQARAGCQDQLSSWEETGRGAEPLAHQRQ